MKSLKDYCQECLSTYFLRLKNKMLLQSSILSVVSQKSIWKKYKIFLIVIKQFHNLILAKKNNLNVKEEKGKGIYVADATEVYVTNPEEMFEIMRAGSKNRSIAATRMNEKSSRSHSVFILTVYSKNTKTDAAKLGKLYLCDLAGSEKIGKTMASGQTLEEAKMINKSLSALGNVINALTEAKSGAHVPYRDSKLTRIL